MILVSLSGCYGILHQINLILNLVVVYFTFFLFSFSVKKFKLTEYHKSCEAPLFWNPSKQSSARSLDMETDILQIRKTIYSKFLSSYV